jgi:hypothetical protein
LSVLIARMAWADLCILRANYWMKILAVPLEAEEVVQMMDALSARIDEFKARLDARPVPLNATRDPFEEGEVDETQEVDDETLVRGGTTEEETPSRPLPTRDPLNFGRTSTNVTPFHKTPAGRYRPEPNAEASPGVRMVAAPANTMSYVQSSVLAKLNMEAITSGDAKKVAVAIEAIASHIVHVPDHLWVSTFLPTRFQHFLDQMQRIQFKELLAGWRDIASVNVPGLLQLVFLDPLIVNQLTAFSEVIDPQYFTIRVYRGMQVIQLHCAYSDGLYRLSTTFKTEVDRVESNPGELKSVQTLLITRLTNPAKADPSKGSEVDMFSWKTIAKTQLMVRHLNKEFKTLVAIVDAYIQIMSQLLEDLTYVLKLAGMRDERVTG